MTTRDAASPLRCFACGRRPGDVTDGPTADEAGQCRRWEAGVLDVHETDDRGCRAAVACWACFWRTDPDMWISSECWAALDPVVPYEKLPVFDHDAPNSWDPAAYPWPVDVPLQMERVRRGHVSELS